MSTSQARSDDAVTADQVIDLSALIHPDGTLDWNPPPGHWTVLRFGYSLTGKKNGPAEKSSTGLEVDKLDADMVRQYLEHYVALYSDASGGRLGPSGIQNLLTDSWEAGVQNWTPLMLSQFKARRGYDLVKYAPVLAGWVVDDSVTSDRFLWDFRRTLKEMLADNHYGTIAKILHEHHMDYYSEAEGDTPRSIGDGMSIKARSDIPTGEFWYRPFATDEGQPPLRADLEESASVAHLYGKPFAASESLTVAATSDPWAFSPDMLKPIIDEIFAHGINRILLHESHHQPFADKAPGLQLAFFGQFFNRNDTWAEQAKPWIDYIARTSYMLQQGRYVADVAYFYGEDHNLTELFQHQFNTDVPTGYHYDYVNSEVLLNLLSVKDGKLVTPSGMSYKVLYLPSHVDHFTLPVLKKISDLIAAGATVVGPKPVGGLGLKDEDQEIKAIADKVWGMDVSKPTSHHFGTGRVYPTADLAAALRFEGLKPDIDVRTNKSDAKVLTLHRKAADRDIYFLVNHESVAKDVTVTCRLQGLEPEIWHAKTEASSEFHMNRLVKEQR